MNDEHRNEDWAASVRWRYLHDADFHGAVEMMVRERNETKQRCSNTKCHLHYAHSGPCDTRLFECNKALRVMTRAADLAAARAERWENAYWSLLDNGGHL